VAGTADYHLAMDPELVNWLIMGAVGPALAALPVNWTASELSGAARRWLRRLRHTDGLSRLVQAAGASAGLTRSEFAAVRRLLEARNTWRLMGSGTVEELAEKIGSCLGRGRDPLQSLTVARAIAQGLLEFAAFDLEPEVFQRVLLARLSRLEVGQATSLDQTMLRLNADLAARFAQQSQDDDERFRRVMTQLGQVLDRLPAGAADREEVALYLAALIRWLNVDPWPRDRRLRGPVLTPASIERKLIVAGATSGRHLDADELADQCTRLVILGGPGSGKTWLAMRTARRCADAALQALTAGVDLDEIELPLFTTCSLLAGEGGNIRHAAVTSALDQLGDLGGSRIAGALRVFFTERRSPMLLVIDSLDEARHPDARLRQADTLPWRIVLTSRPSSWNEQLEIREKEPKHRIGSLRSLRYPTDVEPFIARWFTYEPELGRAVAAQIASQPRFQEAATVPLILAFYCIIGGDQPLPATRRDLYPLVLRRILTGLWRGNDRDRPNADACLTTLREWAWAGAASDTISGLGTWADEILTPYVAMNQPDQAAVDHVATPLSPENLDTRVTPRRFIHRSIREHLTAEYVATRMTAEQAATELLTHLWYDPDWEYVAPAALVMHPRHDEVLTKLVCQVARSEEIPDDLASIDSCRELPRFLARLAMESREADWTADSAAIICRAGLDFAPRGRSDLGLVPGWAISNRLTRQALVALLADEKDPWKAKELTKELSRLNPGPREREQAGRAIVLLLDREERVTEALGLTEALVSLDPDPDQRGLAATIVLALLARNDASESALWLTEALVSLDPDLGQRAQARQKLLDLLGRNSGSWSAARLTEALVSLDPDLGQRAQARQKLLDLLGRENDAETVGRLTEMFVSLEPDPGQRRQATQVVLALLARNNNSRSAERLTRALARLYPGPREREQAGQVLLVLLARQNAESAGTLAEALAELGPHERHEAGQALLMLLAREKDAQAATWLTEALVRLDPIPGQREHATQALVALLALQGAQGAGIVAKAAALLGPEGRDRAGQGLLALLARENDPWKARDLAKQLVEMDPSPGERAQATQLLLELLSRHDGEGAGAVAEGLVELGPEERAQAGQELLALLARETDPWKARGLTKELAKLNPNSDERERATRVLVTLLSRQRDPHKVRDLVLELAHMEPGPDQLEDAAHVVLALLTRENDARFAAVLAEALVRLDPGLDEQDQAARVLLGRMARGADPEGARMVAGVLARLDLAPGQQEQAAQAVLALLTREKSVRSAVLLTGALARLKPGPGQREQAAEALLALLALQGAKGAGIVARTVALLGPRERARAGQALLALLARESDPWQARDLTRELSKLDPGPREREQAGQVLLALLARENDPWKAMGLIEELAKLELDLSQRERAGRALAALLARESNVEFAVMFAGMFGARPGLDLGPAQRDGAGMALLSLLSRKNKSEDAAALVKTMVRLKLSLSQREQAGRVLAAQLTLEKDPFKAQDLVSVLARLDLGCWILESSRYWAVPPGRDLMARARWNSALSSWLETLPTLGGSPV
jgi:hypothetical protein